MTTRPLALLGLLAPLVGALLVASFAWGAHVLGRKTDTA